MSLPVLTLCAILALCLLTASRTGAAVCLILAVCYLTEGQQLSPFGLRLSAMRVLLVVAALRVVVRREFASVRPNHLDKAVLAYIVLVQTLATLRVGTSTELIYRCGLMADALLSYFVFVSLLHERSDLQRVVRCTCVLVVPFALLVTLESMTGRNAFAGLGGVYEHSWIREGHFRSAGSFRNAITAGSFGANILLLAAAELIATGWSAPGLIGVLAGTVIVIASHSSGPFLGVLIGVFALSLWPLRDHMRLFRWGIVAGISALAVLMKAPIWFAIARVGDLVGGGAYHRALLIDRFVNGFSTWWLVGTADTAKWFPYSLADGKTDITNRFVADGLDAGLIGLILSILLIVRGFKQTGQQRQLATRLDPAGARLSWGLGATLAANVVILCSVTYFDQMYVMWYFVLAAIAHASVTATIQATDQPDPRVPITAGRWRAGSSWVVDERAWHGPSRLRTPDLTTDSRSSRSLTCSKGAFTAPRPRFRS